MNQLNSMSIVFLAALIIQMSGPQIANADEHDIADVVSTEIELERLVHFSGPTGDPVTLGAGRYLVEKRDAKTLQISAEDGESHVIAAAASEHDETLPGSQALSVPIGDDAYRILFLQTDGSSLEAAGTYSGVVSRDVSTAIDMGQVSAAYEDWLQAENISLRALRPQAFDGGYKVAETWQQRMERQRAGRLSSSLLRNTIGKTFAQATISAQACGGSYDLRKTIINIPNAPFYNEQPGLPRLHYDFTNGEREKFQWKNCADCSPMRRYSIRACVDDWRVRGWQGQVANGRLELHVVFGDSTITTRALDHWQVAAWVWRKRWNWNDINARYSTPDLLNYPVLIVTMKPGFSRGRVTVELEKAQWDNRKNMFSSFGGMRALPTEANKFEGYKLSILNNLLSRYRVIFENQAVRTQLSKDLTQALLANSYVNSITGIDWPNSAGAVITVNYN